MTTRERTPGLSADPLPTAWAAYQARKRRREATARAASNASSAAGTTPRERVAGAARATDPPLEFLRTVPDREDVDAALDEALDESMDDGFAMAELWRPGLAEDAARLVETYRAQDDEDRLLLQLLSLCSMATSAVELLRVLQHGTLPGHQARAATIGERLRGLAARGLVRTAAAGTYTCADGCAQLALREAARRPDHAALLRAVERALAAPAGPSHRGAFPPLRAVAGVLRAARLAIAQGDESALQRAYLTAERRELPLPPRDELVGSELGSPFEPDWLHSRPRALQVAALRWLLREGLYTLHDVGASVDEAWRWWHAQGRSLDPGLRQALAVNLLLRGRVGDAQTLILDSEEPELLACAGWVDLGLGERDSACAFVDQGLRALRARIRWSRAFFGGVAALPCAIALLARGHDDDLAQLSRMTLHGSGPAGMAGALRPLVELASRWSQASPENRRQPPARLPVDESPALVDVLAVLAGGLATCWSAAIPDDGLLHDLRTGANLARARGLWWLADQLADLHPRLAPGAIDAPERDPAAAAVPLASLVAPRPEWERVLAALVDVGRAARAPREHERRLAWFLDLEEGAQLEVREQRRTRRGAFSRGRRLGSGELVHLAHEAEALPPQDLELVRALLAEREDRIQTYRSHLGARAARALIGHPRVFWAGQPEQPIEVVAGRPELHVRRRSDGGVRLALVPRLASDEATAILREGSGRARVFELDARQRAIAAILGDGLDLPAAAETRFVEALSSAATVVDLHAELDLVLAGVEARAADPVPRARIGFAGRDLRVELVARPLGDSGPTFEPGQGPATVVTARDGERVLVRRDLDDEARRARACVEACPGLGPARDPALRFEIADPQRSLELLAELRALGDAVVLEWCTESRVRVRAAADLSRLRLRVGKGREWFALQGELRVDDALVLDMRRLLELSALVPGRVVPLGDGEFLALSAELRRRLDTLRDLTQLAGDELRVHALAASAVEQALRGAGDVERSADFTARLDEIERALRSQPTLPRGLQLELRPYQREGYGGLARLASGGVGACLADDMGLGKTAQVLALLLVLGERGPSLVVAPTSVCGTWSEQAAAYAPSLRVVDLRAGDRAGTLASLGPGDLLLCSYALLVREAEALRQVDFACAVLDEAQAIKNAATKRWKAAAELRARARVITTGTPVENHLDELWALFAFLNPGLLGTREDFARRFAVPVERDRDRERLGHLKALIAPYVLRRTKQQVLTELPPRTVIDLEVEMGTAERAHYEALRQRALERLAQPAQGSAHPGHVRILAEITRLRRACSNPAMVSPEAGLPSCKLEACVELLDQLRRGGHRTLVFSQWLDQLAALQLRLDALGFSQLYLDGTTPADERQRRIEAFQAGQADVFLISLRAGGQGINLTAADYVVHVDPWWNPAVEDQASDRAHRLGQTRPVTIYRLVVKNSIEERILALHQSKRDLASRVLSGGELAARLSADELLDLIRQGG